MQKVCLLIFVVLLLCLGTIAYGQQVHPLAEPGETSFVHPEQNRSYGNSTDVISDPEYLSCQYTETTNRSFYNGTMWTGTTFCGSSDGKAYKGSLSKILIKYEIMQFETHGKDVRLLLRKKR